MRMTAEEQFFSIIKDLLCESPRSSIERESLSEERLGELYTLSKKHDLAPLVGYALARDEKKGKESGFDKKFQKQQMVAMLRHERMEHELTQIRSVLEEAEIRFLPLKGAKIRSLYPKPWLRTSCDIDILIDEEQLDPCVGLLCEKLGYTTDGTRQFHDVSLHAPSGVHLELHFSILENISTIDRELSRVWEHSHPIAPERCEYEQTNEYLVFHSVAHMAYHFVKGGCGIRPFLDLFLMEQRLPINQVVLDELLSACELSLFYQRVKELISVWFGEAEHTDLTRKMQAFLLAGGVYGSMENFVTIEQKKAGGKGKYLLRRIFLPYHVLSLQYPVLTRKKWLLLICQIRRWGRLLFGGKARRSARELYKSAQISKEKTEGVGWLLSELGLE